MANKQSDATNGADDFSRLSMEEVGRKALEIRSCLVDIYGTPPLLLDALGKLENRFQELKALPSARVLLPGWRPVEQQPEKTGQYLCRLPHQYCVCSFETSHVDGKPHWNYASVIWWMPVPPTPVPDNPPRPNHRQQA